MLKPVIAIARFTLLEALRNRLVWLLLIAIGLCATVGLFLQSVAITESQAVYLAVTAALSRVAVVSLVAFFVIASVAREQQDKSIDFVLAMPLSRGQYLGGKALGFLVVGAVAAVGAASPLLIAGSAEGWMAWTATLFFEVAIISAFALFCALTLTHIPVALIVTLGFYALARTIGAMTLMAENPVLPSLQSGDWMTGAVSGLAYVLPSLDQFADSAWLLYTPADSTAVGGPFIQALVYCGLLAGAALFDLYRKEL